MGKYLRTKEEVEVSEPAAKRVASEEEESGKSKLWSCLSEILKESNQFEGTVAGEDNDIESTQPSEP